MPAPYQLITFDVYTALFDVEASLTSPVARAIGDGQALAVVRLWRSKQLEYALISNSLARGRVSFWRATRLALDYALSRAGFAISDSAREALMEHWTSLAPYPEADEVLSAVKAKGYAIAVLSNGDEAMLREVIRCFRTPFDRVFAADHAGHYKPHPSVYALPQLALSLKATDILHVAGSATDTLGAKSAGLTCAWTNRQNDFVLDPAFDADFQIADLRGVLEII